MTPEIKNLIEQIQRGEVPEGYKRTKVGIVPYEWSCAKMSDMFDRLNRKNKVGNTNVLTISAQHGLISQEKFFNKSVASEDKGNYFLLKQGNFAYNKSYSNGYPFGAIKCLTAYDSGIVSPLYICFEPAKENQCPEYFAQYFDGGFLNREIHAVAQEGARNHGLLNIGVDDFFSLNITVPPLAEQKKIAEILAAQDRVIELYQRKIDEIKKLKKICLSKMFPQKGHNAPEIRFPEFTDAWEQRKFADVVQIERGGSPRPIDDYITDSQNGLNWVKIGDAPAQGHYITKTAEKIRPEGLSKTREVHPGDLILSNSMSFGKPYIMGIDGCIHDGWLLIRDTNSTFDLTFLCHLLGTPQMLDQYRSLAAGSTVNNLNKELVGNTVVTIPTIDEQRVLGQYLERLDNLITLHQRKLEELQRHKKALMQLLLTGIVRVKL